MSDRNEPGERGLGNVQELNGLRCGVVLGNGLPERVAHIISLAVVSQKKQLYLVRQAIASKPLQDARPLACREIACAFVRLQFGELGRTF
jgi:hypothetical protein